MAITYTRTLPNLTQTTRRAAYGKLSNMVGHMAEGALGSDLISISIDTVTRIITVVVTNQLDSDNLEYWGLS
jgi:hypothetical protein